MRRITAFPHRSYKGSLRGPPLMRHDPGKAKSTKPEGMQQVAQRTMTMSRQVDGQSTDQCGPPHRDSHPSERLLPLLQRTPWPNSIAPQTPGRCPRVAQPHLQTPALVYSRRDQHRCCVHECTACTTHVHAAKMAHKPRTPILAGEQVCDSLVGCVARVWS